MALHKMDFENKHKEKNEEESFYLTKIVTQLIHGIFKK